MLIVGYCSEANVGGGTCGGSHIAEGVLGKDGLVKRHCAARIPVHRAGDVKNEKEQLLLVAVQRGIPARYVKVRTVQCAAVINELIDVNGPPVCALIMGGGKQLVYRGHISPRHARRGATPGGARSCAMLLCISTLNGVQQTAVGRSSPGVKVAQRSVAQRAYRAVHERSHEAVTREGSATTWHHDWRRHDAQADGAEEVFARAGSGGR